ncbi:DUF4129 domain-containing protein [Botrimarina mediterranea]|uniref:Protein-glutamine gamma-glutamyltransferase-like C-terminal domain-containing protein n=1 Tax=Botrimarina mediterranea TaxID=2528022 RepID=A0A518K2F3_9BACT|nr:DUF4129 domain-containing protein [Botrimarina mediterranea]QDV71949.1 hypothetical protein Spa11_01180 [Botrimarina mediterranea]QDV76490.1 hypothetical protein K2D_00680 [Planctomycetes bacterium K2D]
MTSSSPPSFGDPPAWHDADAIRAAATEVLSRADYDLQRGAERPATEWVEGWLRWLTAPLRWLFDSMEGLPDGLRWLVIILLLILLVLLVAHIVWTLVSSLSTPRLGSLQLSSTKESRVLDPKVMEAEARQLASAGDYVGACRLLLQASLARLQQVRSRRFSPGLTNSELLREYAATSIAEPLKQLVRTVELKWYGDEPCLATDYERCEASHEVIRRTVQERHDALSA